MNFNIIFNINLEHQLGNSKAELVKLSIKIRGQETIKLFCAWEKRNLDNRSRVFNIPQFLRIVYFPAFALGSNFCSKPPGRYRIMTCPEF